MSSNVRLPERELTARDTRFLWGSRTYVMGIVNATPDSFSGDGLPDADAAIERGLDHLDNGADLLDVGAESTRPGHTPISEDQELQRLLPVVRGLRERAPHAVLSVDTFKPGVFRAARAAGADMLNSIWGIDDALLAAALETAAPIVIMHNKRVAVYEGNVVDEVLRSLLEQAERAVRAGLPPAGVIVDPGIGFGKTPEHNLAILHELDRFAALGFPLLLGTSRKSTIGKLTGREPGDRAFGTAATVALAIAAGVDIVRVHDVAAMCDTARVGDAIVRHWRPEEWTQRI